MLRQFRPSVCLSSTRVDCIETAEHIIEILLWKTKIKSYVDVLYRTVPRSMTLSDPEPNF